MPETAMDLAQTEKSPPKGTKVCLNMIIGPEREPYLAASLESLADLCDWAVINLNGPDDTGEFELNLKDVLDCRFNQEDRLTLLGLPFRNFSFNRNICLEASKNAEWILVSAADEVWYPKWDGKPFAQLLEEAESFNVTRVIGHFWHFLKGHEFVHNTRPKDPTYTQHVLLRNHPDLGYHGVVHEQPSSPYDRDLVIGEVFAHFSYVDPVRVFKKWVQYEVAQGRPGFYDNYFNDPNATWRKEPKHILDDREGTALREFGVDLPEAIKGFTLDSDFHLHSPSCQPDKGKGNCCGHDPLVCKKPHKSGDPIPDDVKAEVENAQG